MDMQEILLDHVIDIQVKKKFLMNSWTIYLKQLTCNMHVANKFIHLVIHN